MTNIPWDEMPEGATHYDPEDKRAPWLRVMGGWWYFFGDDHWNRDGHINSPSNRRREESCILLVKQPPKPQWRGPEDGFPPVGVECEARIYSALPNLSKWVSGIAGNKAKGQNGGFGCIFESEDKILHFIAGTNDFRPIPTKRDQWIDRAEKIEQALPGAYQPHELLESIHDALRSGELPQPQQE